MSVTGIFYDKKTLIARRVVVTDSMRKLKRNHLRSGDEVMIVVKDLKFVGGLPDLDSIYDCIRRHTKKEPPNHREAMLAESLARAH